jgi:hypothetical protein
VAVDSVAGVGSFALLESPLLQAASNPITITIKNGNTLCTEASPSIR